MVCTPSCPHSPWSPPAAPGRDSPECADRGVDVSLTSPSPAVSTTVHFSSTSSSSPLSVRPPCSLQFLSANSFFRKSWRANSSSQSKSSPGYKWERRGLNKRSGNVRCTKTCQSLTVTNPTVAKSNDYKCFLEKSLINKAVSKIKIETELLDYFFFLILLFLLNNKSKTNLFYWFFLYWIITLK